MLAVNSGSLLPRLLCLSRTTPSSLVSRTLSMAKSTYSSDAIAEVHEKVIKSPNDKRAYRGLTLSNGLKVLLISDPSTDKAAAALDVNVGSMSDPKDLPGLAHFLEHMLFLGTKKFPADGDYSKYVAQNGGYSNAYTTGSHTNYHFDVSSSKLEGALERFVEFFLTPLFTENCTERELNSVHSEHEKNVKEDNWRQLQVERATSDPEHDYSKFSTGNRETLSVLPKSLGIDVRKSLLEFHSKWYSANIMSLAVLGKESLEALTDLVVTRFQNIENKAVSVPYWKKHPYGEHQLRKIIKIVPIKDIRILKLSFATPDLTKHYKSQPGHYLSHLVGHEGKGSLLSHLKTLNLCTSLVAGSKSKSGFGFFEVTVELTEKGISQPNSVIEAIFGYLRLLKESKPQQWIFDELKCLCTIKFKFMEKKSPVEAVCRAASVMQDYPIDEVMSANVLLEDFNSQLVEDLVNILQPENCRVVIIGKIFEEQTDKEEKWYGTKYSVSDMDDSLLQKLSHIQLPDTVHLPLRNEFIPTNLELVEREEVLHIPKLLVNNEMCKLWFRQDNSFLVPKAFFSILITSPFIDSDPLYSSSLSLFTSLLRDSMNEYAYDAELAGLSYNLSSAPFGLNLTVTGYNEKLKTLLLKIVEKICAFNIAKDRFETFKEMYFRKLRNFEMSSLRVLTTYYVSLLLSQKYWSREELLKTENQLTFDKFKEAVAIVFSKFHLEVLADGNLTSKEAVSVIDDIEEAFRLKFSSTPVCNSQLRRSREFKLPANSSHIFEVNNKVQPDNAVYVYFQIGQEQIEEKLKLELLEHVIASHCFNKLRTVEQLGYIVSCSRRSKSGVQGLRIVVQSEHNPAYVERRIEHFILWAKEYLTNLPEDEFVAYKNGILAKKADKPKQLIHSSFEMFAEIYKKEYLFDRRNIEMSKLEKIEKKDIVDFFHTHIDVSAEKRRKLVVRIASSHSENVNKVPNGEPMDRVSLPEEVRIEDINEFQNGLSLYPLPKTFFNVTTNK